MTLALALLLSAVLPSQFPDSLPNRAVAVTFDDLPLVSAVELTGSERKELTDRLLTAITRHRVPAIGFVNEKKVMDQAGGVDSSRVDLLRSWLAAGMELGNHTWSHPDLHRVSLTQFQDDVLRGELVTRQLLALSGKTPRYFRHPFLHTGRSLAVRDSLTHFLAQHGYTVAPVTIDNSDYVFAVAYDRARAQGDSSGTARLRTAYLDYMDSVTVFYQRQADAILGRELPQVLLLHANRLNADTFASLAEMFQRRGYRFVSLEQALTDPAYRHRDDYTGPAGITWLHRWAMTAGVSPGVFRDEPEVPDWVADWPIRP